LIKEPPALAGGELIEFCIFIFMKQRIYIDTSIVGGFFDKEFAEPTKALFEKLERKEIIFVISDLLIRELEKAPENVRSLLNAYSQECFESISLIEAARELADNYISEKVVGKTSLEDCQHIAMATINKVDILASWNFKHIVNINRIRGYNSVNLKKGYATLEIRSPKDLVEYEDD
jgi:predicted nucleic acid-binding protein